MSLGGSLWSTIPKTDMMRTGYPMQGSKGWIAPGMGLGNEESGQAGQDPAVVLCHSQAPWSATEGVPSRQQKPVVPLPHLHRAWAGCEPARWQRAMCWRIITVKNSLGFIFFF